MEINLIEKQKEVNAACGFQTDNLDGLILGLISEIGELASVIALKEGLKKPKPKDLEKFGRWKKNHAGYIIDTSMFVEVINSKESGFRKYQLGPFSFEEAFNHERTQSALKGNISEELADVLVYFLQISIYANFEFTSLDKFRDANYPAESPSNEVISLLPILLGLSVQAKRKEEYTENITTKIIFIAKVKTNLCFVVNILLSIAKHYEIDLQQAYLNKCEKLLKRHAQAKTVVQQGGNE